MTSHILKIVEDIPILRIVEEDDEQNEEEKGEQESQERGDDLRSSTQELFKVWDMFSAFFEPQGTSDRSSLVSSVGLPTTNIEEVEEQLVSLWKSTNSSLRISGTTPQDLDASISPFPVPATSSSSSSSSSSAPPEKEEESDQGEDKEGEDDEVVNFITDTMTTQSLIDSEVIENSSVEPLSQTTIKSFYQQVEDSLIESLQQTAYNPASLALFSSPAPTSFSSRLALLDGVTPSSSSDETKEDKKKKKRSLIRSVARKVSSRIFKKNKTVGEVFDQLPPDFVPIVNPDLMERFQKKRSDLKSKGRDTTLHLVYHGTANHSAARIAETGFIIPQLDPKHQTYSVNGASFGIGVYCSPMLNTAMSYQRGSLLVCACVLGKCSTDKARTITDVLDPSTGYDFDSHDPVLGVHCRVFVIHDTDAILPLYILYF